MRFIVDRDEVECVVHPFCVFNESLRGGLDESIEDLKGETLTGERHIDVVFFEKS